MYIEKIDSPKDVKRLSVGQLNGLAGEIRQALLAKLSAHGGHIGPNLGMVEAAIALHYVFDSPKDKMVYDVSHQSYVHKMLTGRNAAFLDPARYDEVSASPFKSLALARPQARLTEVDVCPTVKKSCSLSSGLV